MRIPRRPTSRAAIAEYDSANAALWAHQQAEDAAGVTEESEEFLRLNRAATDAALRVSWWRRTFR